MENLFITILQYLMQIATPKEVLMVIITCLLGAILLLAQRYMFLKMLNECYDALKKQKEIINDWEKFGERTNLFILEIKPKLDVIYSQLPDIEALTLYCDQLENSVEDLTKENKKLIQKNHNLDKQLTEKKTILKLTKKD